MFNSPESLHRSMLLCRECGVLYPLPPDRPAPEPDEVEDLESFRSTHRHHTLERAHRLAEPVFHDRPPWDPMARAWFQVAVGESALFVCSSRSSIEEPRRHQVCHEPPQLSLRAEVDEPLLRRALEQHFFPNRISPEKLNAFLDATRRCYAAVDAPCVETSFDDTELPNAEIGPCPLEVAREVRRAACQVFDDPWERSQLLDFIDANTDEYGALAVRVLREIGTSA